MKGVLYAFFFTCLFATASAGPLPSGTFPPALSASQHTWVQTGITSYGIQADGLNLYGFDFLFTNTGTTALSNVYEIIPDDPAVNFGITDGVWDPALKAWTANTAAGLVIAKPYNMVGFLDPLLPENPIFAVASYLAPGQSTTLEMQFEISPVVGYFEFDGVLAAVPEPATLALLASGLIAFGWARRRGTALKHL